MTGTAILLSAGALIAGALMPLQAGSNAALARGLGHPLWATFVSLSVSILVLIVVMMCLRVSAPQWLPAIQLPSWAWLGGIGGVIYVSAALFITPKLGATGFIVAVIAGQMVASLVMDYFGLMGLPQQNIHWGRILGVLLIMLGVLVVQWSSRTIP